MRYFNTKISGYFRTVCEKCIDYYKGDRSEIKTEDQRTMRCWNCGDNTPIKSKKGVK
jgi:hypothetical protein